MVQTVFCGMYYCQLLQNGKVVSVQKLVVLH